MDTLGKQLSVDADLAVPFATASFRLKNVLMMSVHITYSAGARGDFIYEVSSLADGNPDTALGASNADWVVLDFITLAGGNPDPLNHMWKDGQAAYNFMRVRWEPNGANALETASIGVITKGDE